MRTAQEISDHIRREMVERMRDVWEQCSPEEKAAYRLRMEGMDMWVQERQK